MEYQLLNALSVRNVEKFMDIVLRLYSAYGSRKNENGQELLIPTGLGTNAGKFGKIYKIWICICNGIGRML